MLRAVAETESTQENIQGWLKLDQGDLGFQLLTVRNCAVRCAYLLSSAFLYYYISHKFFVFQGYVFLS
jgi:hypothetical protein